MARLIWTPPAVREVAQLHGFLAPKNRDAAQRAVRAIRQGVNLLMAHPEIGRPVDAMPAGFRDWFIQFGDGGYVVLYCDAGDVTTILAVRHGRRAGYQPDREMPC